MLSSSGASIQSSYWRVSFAGEANGNYVPKVSFPWAGFLRKNVEWKESRSLKAMACNVLIMKECRGLTLKHPFGQHVANCSQVVKIDKEDSGFLIERKPLDARSNQMYSLWRSPRVHCKAATSGDLSGSSPGEMSQYERIIETLTTLFPVWVILGTVIGIYKPAMVTWLETDLFTLGLGFLMLSMGLTLTFEDFRRCLRNPWTVGVGFLAQYLIKPMLGFFIAIR